MRIEPDIRRQRLRVFLTVSVAGLAAALLIFALLPRGAGALADMGWKGGEYRDSADPNLGGARPGTSATTRSTRGPVVLGDTATQQSLTEFRQKAGLDRPLVEQYETFNRQVKRKLALTRENK